jgi:hypothetical protein
MTWKSLVLFVLVMCTKRPIVITKKMCSPWVWHYKHFSSIESHGVCNASVHSRNWYQRQSSVILLLVIANVIASLPILVILRLEAIRSSETPVLTRATWSSITEVGLLNKCRIASGLKLFMTIVHMSMQIRPTGSRHLWQMTKTVSVCTILGQVTEERIFRHISESRNIRWRPPQHSSQSYKHGFSARRRTCKSFVRDQKCLDKQNVTAL